jgi:hypothetical protein
VVQAYIFFVLTHVPAPPDLLENGFVNVGCHGQNLM